MKIGIVGFSSNRINERDASSLLRGAITRLVTAADNGETVEIVTGLTNIGVPKLAYQFADERGYYKVGISAAQAYHVDCGIYPVDKTHIVGEKFGDESDAFIAYIEYLVAVGGGSQSQKEIALFKAKCEQKQWCLSDRLIVEPLQLTS